MGLDAAESRNAMAFEGGYGVFRNSVRVEASGGKVEVNIFC